MAFSCGLGRHSVSWGVSLARPLGCSYIAVVGSISVARSGPVFLLGVGAGSFLEQRLVIEPITMGVVKVGLFLVFGSLASGWLFG